MSKRDVIIKGIEWAVAQNADVINLSLGGGLSTAEDCDADGDDVVAAVNDAAAPILEGGSNIVVVISSGNDNRKQGVSFPACASGAIAVGAVDKSDEVASFSNSGPALDIVAPGVSILSTYSCSAPSTDDCTTNWAARLSGTSMSAPHVAGVAALILEKNPDFDVNQVKLALYSTAVDVGKWDGNGRVDAWGAVNYIATTDDTTPPDQPNITTASSTTNDNTPPLAGTAEAGSTITVTSSVDDVLATTALTSNVGTWSFVGLDALSDNAHTITVTATDASTNESVPSASITITVDTTPPADTVTVSSISPLTIEKGNTILVTIEGSGFKSGASVTFENGTCGKSPSASTVSVSADGTSLTAEITAKSSGPKKDCKFDVRVTNLNASTGVLLQEFTVKPQN